MFADKMPKQIAVNHQCKMLQPILSNSLFASALNIMFFARHERPTIVQSSIINSYFIFCNKIEENSKLKLYVICKLTVLKENLHIAS